MNFDAEIQRRLKSYNRVYEGSKPSPQDWADMLEEDTNFAEEFKRVFNNSDFPEADSFTSQVLEDTYEYMKVSLTRDEEDPNFSKVIKYLRYANGIPIGRYHEYTMSDTRVYKSEYLDLHKASLA